MRVVQKLKATHHAVVECLKGVYPPEALVENLKAIWTGSAIEGEPAAQLHADAEHRALVKAIPESAARSRPMRL